MNNNLQSEESKEIGGGIDSEQSAEHAEFKKILGAVIPDEEINGEEYEDIRMMIREICEGEVLAKNEDCIKLKEYYRKQSEIAHNHLIDMGQIRDKYLIDLQKLWRDMFNLQSLWLGGSISISLKNQFFRKY